MNMESFIALSIIPILSPGPSTYLLTHNTYKYGFKRAALYLIADELGTFMMALITLIALRELLIRYPGVFPMVKVIGSIYVIALGAICLRNNYSRAEDSPVLESKSPFLLTFLVGFTNPKTVIFFTLLSESLILSPVNHALAYALQKYSCLMALSLLLTIAREHIFRQKRLAVNIAATALFGFGAYAFSNTAFAN